MKNDFDYASANPPPYSAVMPTTAYPPVHSNTSAVPQHAFQPMHVPGGGIAIETSVHQHQPSAPGFVISQPISSAPPLNYGSTMYSNQMPPNNQVPPPESRTIVVTVPGDIRQVGGCSACRIGVLEDNYPCCAICLCIFFFPIGILCCCAMRNKRCSHCGVEF